VFSRRTLCDGHRLLMELTSVPEVSIPQNFTLAAACDFSGISAGARAEFRFRLAFHDHERDIVRCARALRELS
jgi:hypothetical protein